MIRVISCIFTEHNLWLVAVAGAVCVLCWTGAVMVMERVRMAPRKYQTLWRLLAGLAAGGGTWATHFIAMLAFDPSVPIGFDPELTIASALIGVLGAWGAFEIFDRVEGHAGVVIAGVLLGASVAILHYVGMAGIVAAARTAWDIDLVVASILFSAAFAVTGLALLRGATTSAQKVFAAAALILGVLSLHFTGAGAMSFIPDASVVASGAELDRSGLAALVTAGACVFLLVAALFAVADRRIAAARLASAERMQRLADVAFEGLLIHDGRVVRDVNRRFAEMSGHDMSELIGTSLQCLTDAESYMAIEKAVRNGSELPVEARLSSGVEVEVQTRAVPGPERAWVSAIRDLGPRRRAELAERENRAKSQFLANMSHELRTPLNAIIGYAELIADVSSEPMTVRDAGHIRASGRHLLSLINDILDYARAEAGRVDIVLDQCSLPGLIEETAAALKPAAMARRNRISIEIDPSIGMVNVDGLRLRQCVLNLLSNAVKFTENGWIAIRVTPSEINGAEAVDIAITDTGIGMTPQQTDAVFEAFVQADASISRRFGGTGLGLAITKRMVNLMGGDVSVTSVLGKGSRFVIQMPVNAQLELSAERARVA